MELEFIEWLRSRLPDASGIALGLRDDAAILTPPPGKQLVVTTDALVDGTHFDTKTTSLELIGRKSLAVNLSDLAAMAAEPVAAFVSVVAPRDGADGEPPQRLLQSAFAGILALAEEFDVAIAGGDTNLGEAPLTISITLLGNVDHGKAWLRRGAHPGDVLVVTGPLGGSIAGHHLTFTPRVREALAIAQSCDVHAAIDISDGLLLDLSRVCQASGVGAELDAKAIPISEAACQLADGNEQAALERALSDGEDFELLIAIAPQSANVGAEQGLIAIGRVTEEPGLWLRDANTRKEVAALGYQHT